MTKFIPNKRINIAILSVAAIAIAAVVYATHNKAPTTHTASSRLAAKKSNKIKATAKSTSEAPKASSKAPNEAPKSVEPEVTSTLEPVTQPSVETASATPASTPESTPEPTPASAAPASTPAHATYIPQSATVNGTARYSHTENGHAEGQYYAIPASTPAITSTATGYNISGTVSRLHSIGVQKDSIIMNYSLNFDTSGNYISGNATSSGYVTVSIQLVPGQNYAGQSVQFLTTSGGYAKSGSYIYPMSATLQF